MRVEGIRLLVDPAPETGGRKGTRIKKRLSVCVAHGDGRVGATRQDGPWWPPGEAWLSKQSPQAAEGDPALQSPRPTHTPPTGDVSPKRTINRELQDMNKTSKVKKLISVAVIPGGYIHR